MRRKISLLFFFFLLFVVFGCGGPKALSPEAREKLLLERVAAYWDLRVKGASAKERLPFERCGLKPECREAFLRGGGSGQSITYYSYQVLGVRYPDEKTAMVKLKIRYKVPPILGKSFEQESTFEDKWEYIDGQWYHVIRGFSTEW